MDELLERIREAIKLCLEVKGENAEEPLGLVVGAAEIFRQSRRGRCEDGTDDRHGILS